MTGILQMMNGEFENLETELPLLAVPDTDIQNDNKKPNIKISLYIRICYTK